MNDARREWGAALVASLTICTLIYLIYLIFSIKYRNYFPKMLVNEFTMKPYYFALFSAFMLLIEAIILGLDADLAKLVVDIVYLQADVFQTLSGFLMIAT